MSIKHIVRDRTQTAGKARIHETDVTVEFILRQLASGASVEEIRNSHPQLTEGLILEAIAFAADEFEKAESDAELREWSQEFIEEYRPALEALAKSMV
jgi:uncharacterized protein (DUF433 family)